MDDLYELDVLRWSERQAALLRRLAAGERVNDQIDWENVTEEVESLGREQLHAVESLLFQALVHRLKAECWPNSPSVAAWRADARGFLAPARRRFAPSMRQRLDLSGIYDDALKALPDAMDGQPPLPPASQCPVSLDDLLAGA